MTDQKYPFRLNEEIEEEIEVDQMIPILSEDKKNATYEMGKVKTKIKTIYTKTEEEKFMCGKGEHKWEMADRHKYIAKCLNNKCIKRRILNPTIHTIKEGHIINRTTKELID